MTKRGISAKRQPDLQGLPNITFRQLEIFSTVCHERSYANAAIELHSTRANVKRACEEFEKAVGRKLFDETDRTLIPTVFAEGLLCEMIPLSRRLRHLEDGVRSIHKAGRVLRFAAAGEFFRGGLFTDFLSRVKINDAFRPCFLRIETARLRNSLLNAECDVYFGVGLQASERMDLLDLGPISWKVLPVGTSPGDFPTHARDLRSGRWAIAEVGEPGAAEALLDAFHAAGAQGGVILAGPIEGNHLEQGHILQPDITAPLSAMNTSTIPCYRFIAVLRKHHPYQDLKSRLASAALA